MTEYVVHFVTCETAEEAAAIVALLSGAEEDAASARASAAHAQSGARKLWAAVREAEQAECNWREEWHQLYQDYCASVAAEQRARTAARAWKRAAKQWRASEIGQTERKKYWQSYANDLRLQVGARERQIAGLETRIRALIAVGGATVAELRDLVE